MKKLGITLGGTAFALLLATSAQAVPYGVDFDADAAGTNHVSQLIFGWDSEAIAKGTVNGALTDLITHQQLDGPNAGNVSGVLDNGDTFYEDITLRVLNGSGCDYADPICNGGNQVGQSYYFGDTGPLSAFNANLYVDVALSGFITNYIQGGPDPTTATNPERILDDSYWGIYKVGDAQMYVDVNGNKTYDVGTDTLVAEFALSDAGPIILTPSVFGPAGAGAQISFAFETSYANTDYFSAATGFEHFFDLITGGLLLTTTQGGVNFSGNFAGDTAADPDEIILGFRETGFDLEFNAIPEPTSMLLLGTGLVGLAGAARRRKKGIKS